MHGNRLFQQRRFAEDRRHFFGQHAPGPFVDDWLGARCRRRGRSAGLLFGGGRFGDGELATGPKGGTAGVPPPLRRRVSRTKSLRAYEWMSFGMAEIPI